VTQFGIIQNAHYFPATRQPQSNNSGASGKAKVSPRSMRRGRLIASPKTEPTLQHPIQKKAQRILDLSQA
jgi:hypothetical protein